MDKAALYLRLSKEDVDKMDKGDDSESIINQRLLLTDYAISHDMQVYDTYSDDDYSGLYDDRPDFDRLIHDAKLGDFNVVIAKSQSRFTRNMEHVEKYLHHDFPLLGIRFIGVVDGVDTQDAANKKSRQINGLVNEWYCEDLSNNIRAVFQQKMRAGQFLGAFAPYGYRKDPNDKYKFVVDDYAANIVRKIYALFLGGYSVAAISHKLEDEHISNPAIYKEEQGLKYRNAKADDFSKKYGLWSSTTIKRILTNKTYIGTLVQGTCMKASYKDKKVIAVPRDKWIVVENHHEAIIDDDTFYKVTRLRERRRICGVGQEKDKKLHIFAGKLRCADCGHTMVKSGGVRGRKDDWYLRCYLANRSRNTQCTSHNIRYSVIKEEVLKRIQEITDCVLSENGNMIKISSMIQNNDEHDRIQVQKKKINGISNNMDTISNSVKALYLDRVTEKIDSEMFFQLKSKFEDDLQQLINTKHEMERNVEIIERNVTNRNDIYQIVKEHTNYKTLTHEIVNDFVDYIEIGKKDEESEEQEIVIHWNF